MTLDDRHQYFSYASDCANCKHYAGGCSCPAFPSGIPVELLSGDKKHDQIMKDQESTIVFQPIES